MSPILLIELPEQQARWQGRDPGERMVGAETPPHPQRSQSGNHAALARLGEAGYQA